MDLIQNRVSRRRFVGHLLGILGGLFGFRAQASVNNKPAHRTSGKTECTLYRVLNGRPGENLSKIIALMGGIEEVIGPDDVVVIKPNVQWWNQGAPNLSALKTFVGLIMNRPGGFYGEVVVAENCHRGPRPWESRESGWNRPFVRNIDLENILNYNDLSKNLKHTYDERFSTCHWINADSGGKRVFGPADGAGYVYCDGTNGVPLISFDNGRKGADRRAVVMSYPIFKTDKGTVVDFKNGIWKNGIYTAQPLKFINFAALNHHSTYCGATSAIKNYLGISDLSGGPDPYNGGQLTEKYYNFHSFPFNKWAPGPEPGMIGAEIGVFMNTVRKADLNITTAEWVGLASRTEPPVVRTRAVLACEDPVALDYHAAKYILYPNSRLQIHNSEDRNSPLYQYLKQCANHGGGLFDEGKVAVTSFDYARNQFQKANQLMVLGERYWGDDLKTILKYLALRIGFF